MLAWRNHFNKRDAAFCQQAYLEDASVYGTLGPAETFLQMRLHLTNPMVLRGRKAIGDFWNATIFKVGLHSFRAFEDGGELAPMVLVVNDDEVVVSGKFSFNALQGHILSQTWVRVKDKRLDDGDSGWKIKTHMFAIDASDTHALEALANSTVRGEVEAEKVVKEVLKELESTEPKASVNSRGFFLPVVVVVLILGSMLAIFIKLRNGRRSYKFAESRGIDAMLG